MPKRERTQTMDIQQPMNLQEGSFKKCCYPDPAVGSDQTSFGFLQAATDFAIHDGNIASIGGDSFTARGDVHVTINHHHSSSLKLDASRSPNQDHDLCAHTEDKDQQQGIAKMSSEGEKHMFDEDTLMLPPLPVQRSCDIYRRHLAAKGRGIPLWIPEPSKNLPVQYQRNGITIGDVGIVTASGGFIFLFNILLPSDHPINPTAMPEGFEPLGSDAVRMFKVSKQKEFKENSYLTSASSVRARINRENAGLIFESSEHDGAILAMPVGSTSEDLGNIIHFRKYVIKNLKNWYNYAYHDCAFEVRNGDLRVVTGCDKTCAWGMATIFNSGSECSDLGLGSKKVSGSLLRREGVVEPKLHLEFGLVGNVNDQSASGEGRLKRYGWECSGLAEVRAGPDAGEVLELRGGGVEEEDTVYENQCLFVRTLNATLPKKVWDELGFEEEEEKVFAGDRANSMDSAGSRASYPSLPSSGRAGSASERPGSLSSGASSSLSTATFQMAALRSLVRDDRIANDYNAASAYSSLNSLAEHPSVAINEHLLKNCSNDITMAVTLDWDWMTVVREDDIVFPSSDELIERIMETYAIREEDGVVFLDSKYDEAYQERNIISSSALSLSFPSVSESSMTSCQSSTAVAMDGADISQSGHTGLPSSSYSGHTHNDGNIQDQNYVPGWYPPDWSQWDTTAMTNSGQEIEGHQAPGTPDLDQMKSEPMHSLPLADYTRPGNFSESYHNHSHLALQQDESERPTSSYPLKDLYPTLQRDGESMDYRHYHPSNDWYPTPPQDGRRLTSQQVQESMGLNSWEESDSYPTSEFPDDMESHLARLKRTVRELEIKCSLARGAPQPALTTDLPSSSSHTPQPTSIQEASESLSTRTESRKRLLFSFNRAGNTLCAWHDSRRERRVHPPRNAPPGYLNCGCSYEEALFEESLSRFGVGSTKLTGDSVRLDPALRNPLLKLLQKRYGYKDGDFERDPVTGTWVEGESPDAWCDKLEAQSAATQDKLKMRNDEPANFLES